MMDSNDRDYTNGEITVFWRPAKCIHATTCYKELIDVFNPRKRPWVNMEGAPTKRIIEVVEKCPTQALYWRYNKDLSADPAYQPKPKEETETFTEIKVMKDGPLLLKGSFRVLNPDGSELKTMRLTSLCRCGSSRNMPFCDGNHRITGFSG